MHRRRISIIFPHNMHHLVRHFFKTSGSRRVIKICSNLTLLLQLEHEHRKDTKDPLSLIRKNGVFPGSPVQIPPPYSALLLLFQDHPPVPIIIPMDCPGRMVFNLFLVRSIGVSSVRTTVHLHTHRESVSHPVLRKAS